jgi:hypothetical protein
MRFAGHIPQNELWLRQVFSAKSVSTGGVVRRRARDVDRKVGRARFELEVRRRGFRLLEVGDQLIVVCSKAPLRIVV